MKRCWANSLEGCDTMSGEHVFSNSIFTPGCGCPTVVEGVRRIRDGAPTRNAETANILCRHHNSALSPLDEEIGRLASFQAKANDENFSDSLYLEGELLERWLLKTVINGAAAGWMGEKKILPSPEIVSAIFGQSVVPHKLGLYSVDGVDPNHSPSGGVSVTPMNFQTPLGPVLAGAYVAVHGFVLFAAFSSGIVERLEAGEVPHFTERFSPEGMRHLYHPGAMVMSRQRGNPVIIGLSWGGLLRFADGNTQPFQRQSAASKG